jgi:hypothetical protein
MNREYNHIQIEKHKDAHTIKYSKNNTRKKGRDRQKIDLREYNRPNADHSSHTPYVGKEEK